MKVLQLTSAAQWKRLRSEWKESKDIVLLKTSPLSTVSFVAEKFFDMWCESISENRTVCCKIDVLENKELSRDISTEFDIKHESPQLIWIKANGEIGWHGHHHEISLDRLNTLNLQMQKNEKEQ